MEIFTEYWHQILFVLAAIVMAVRLESEVKSCRKDIDNLTKELERRDTYVETVRQRSEIDINTKQISSLWNFVNMLRDKVNGTYKR